MRILAVRGQNLASLAEPFDIDLAAEPLATAGLFAITGETGAGKSTLLDAVCLALYGRFPRVSTLGADEDIPDVVDGEALKARDPRSILRRGAASAWAEVDFLAVDGHAYRARWSAYRARNKPGGRLQPAARQIDRLGGDGGAAETVADKIGTADARIVELTDLTFEQFRRTVVLAQGDFDAFLKADDKERADLLEKITGTEIYARLSARAFEKAREARDAVAVLETRRRDIGLMDPETLAERRAARADLAERLAALAAEEAEAGADLARLDRLAAAQARLAEAEAEATAAEAAHAAAGEARDRLARLARAAALRPVVDRLDEARAAEARAVADLARAEAQLAETTPRLEKAREARDRAKAALASVDTAIVGWVPQWEAARTLDVRIAEVRREALEAEAPRQAARTALDAEKARVDAIDARRLDLAGDIARLTLELERLAPLAPLAERWTDVESRLADRLAAADEAREAVARRRGAETTLADLARRLADHATTEAAEGERRSEIEARLAERAAALAAVGEAAMRRRDADLAALQGDVATLLPTATARAAALAEAERAAGDLARAQTEGDAAEGERASLAATRATAEARRAGLAAAVDLADAVASAEALALRGRLSEGEPCPVCGSRDHPIAADPTIVAALARVRAERTALDGEIADLDRRATALDGALAAAAARRAEATRRRDEAATRRAALEADLTDGLARLAARSPSLGLAFDLETAIGDPATALPGFAAALGAERAAAATALARAAVLRGEIDGARADLDRLDAARALRHAARRVDEAADAAARADAATAAEIEAGARRRLGEIDARLAPLLSGLDLGPADLDRDGARLVDRLAAGVADHRARAEAVARATAEEKDLERERHAGREALVRTEEALIGAQATLSAKRDAVARLIAERAPLLGGTATAAHREAIEAERSAAAIDRDAAERALADARTAHEAALTLHGERHGGLVAAGEDRTARELDRDHALAAADLDAETVAALLAEPKERIEALRAEIAGLDRRLTGAHAARAERRRDLDAAIAAGRLARPREAIEAALATARDGAAALNREIGAHDQALAADAAARRTAEGLERDIAEARARRDVRGAVDEAIGSRDGDKFRKFAQGITLDRLTTLANRHLASLNPRYRLARADGLGLTIVDRDMGDEVRSTRSLSGGERFLASLALALALSGLEGRRSFVDTLFVDEGFGSLDAATLDVAIDALERLQSEGRKVGVISHVAAMHDRIPVQIRVEKAGAGRSRVRVTAGA